MVQYKVMASRFNSRCNETKEKLLKGAMIIYIPSEKRAYSLTSQKATNETSGCLLSPPRCASDIPPQPIKPILTFLAIVFIPFVF